MASTAQQRHEIFLMFRAGKSKAEIAKALGTDKKTIARDLAIAIREAGKGRQ